MKKFTWSLAAVSALLLTAGCANTTLTAPPRSATEQLLLSTAVDRAMKTADLSVFRNKKVFLDGTYFDSYDPKNALGTIRDTLSQAGALLVSNATNSEITVEARSGALSIDGYDTLIGLPTTGVPIPLAGVVSIPEVALYKSQRQYSMGKFSLLAYETHTGAHFYSSGPMAGGAYYKYHKVMFCITWVSSDVPEKPRHHY